MVTVVIPVREAAAPAAGVLDPVLAEGADVVVAAAAGTGEDVLAAYRAVGARVLVGDGPRGERLREAARGARGEAILFLHADTYLPPGWRLAVENALAGGAVAGAFRLAFSGGSRRMACIAFWANRRTALTRVPYGDQAPFVSTGAYERVGGHRPWPLLEDVDLFRRLRRVGPIALLPLVARTSPRRYLEGGVLRTALSNRLLVLRWLLGAPPDELARAYRRPDPRTVRRA